MSIYNHVQVISVIAQRTLMAVPTVTSAQEPVTHHRIDCVRDKMRFGQQHVRQDNNENFVSLLEEAATSLAQRESVSTAEILAEEIQKEFSTRGESNMMIEIYFNVSMDWVACVMSVIAKWMVSNALK